MYIEGEEGKRLSSIHQYITYRFTLFPSPPARTGSTVSFMNRSQWYFYVAIEDVLSLPHCDITYNQLHSPNFTHTHARARLCIN